MRRTGFIFWLLSFLLSLAQAQAPAIESWDRRFGGTNGDGVLAVFATYDGGVLLGGASRSNISGNKTQANWDVAMHSADFWVVKIDANGSKEWDKRFGGTSDDAINSICATTDHGYILGGTSASGIGGDKTEACWGGCDFWVVKIDSAGNKQWDKRFGGTLNDILTSVQQTKDGGYIMGGYSNSPVSGDKTQPNWDVSNFDDDYWVVKIDSHGNKQWDKRFGGLQEDGLISMYQTYDGGYMLAGSSHSGQSGDISDTSYGNFDYWVVKIDSLGNKEWDKRYGGTADDELAGMLALPDSGYILAGTSSSGIGGNKTSLGCGNDEYWAVKINALGVVKWDKAYGGLQDDDLRSIAQTKDNGMLMAGFSDSHPSCDKTEANLGYSQSWIIKTDSAGNKQWDKTIFTLGFGELEGYATETSDGCYVIANSSTAAVGGYKTQTPWDTIGDYWAVKFCFEGTPERINNLPDTKLSLSIYPNPFNSELDITLTQQNLHSAAVIITNILGQTIYTQHETNLSPTYTTMLDLSYLPNGVYFLEVVADGERMVREVVKQ